MERPRPRYYYCFYYHHRILFSVFQFSFSVFLRAASPPMRCVIGISIPQCYVEAVKSKNKAIWVCMLEYSYGHTAGISAGFPGHPPLSR